MKTMFALILMLCMDLGYSQTTQITISRYAIPAAGATVTIAPSNFPNLINITTNGVTNLAGNSYTMTYSSLPVIGSTWNVFLDVHHLTFNAGSQITIFGRQPLVDNPNTDTIYMQFTVLYDSTGANGLLDMKYVSGVAQLQTVWGNLTVQGALTVNGLTTFNDSAIANSVPNYSGTISENNALAVSPTSHAISKGCYLTCADSFLYWRIHGNAGTTDTVNFVGTTDNVPLTFKVNGHRSGRIDATLANAFFGYNSGIANTSGNQNAAFGQGSLIANTTGQENAAFGFGSLGANTTGNFNSTVNGLYNVTTGSFNVGMGQGSGASITTGSYNTILGGQADVNTASTSYGISLGYNADASTSQLSISPNVRSLYMPGMPSGVNYVLSDSSGSGNFKAVPLPVQTVLHVRDSISSTQLLAAYSAPTTLIPNPGANYFIKVVSISYNYIYASAAYTVFSAAGVAEGDTMLIDDGGLGGNLIQNTSTRYTYSSLGNTPQQVSFLNQPVTFYAQHTNPTSGSGYLIVFLDYLIEPWGY